MSDYLDERVVEMRFDNQNFEKNVQVSLKTLEELNKRLKLDDAGKSFRSLESASSKFDLSNLTNNVQSVADRFSVLGIVGDQVIRRLTDGFMNLNQSIVSTVKSLTMDQVTVGFDKYERKVQSVQTIMNATGKTIDEVSESLDKLNWFTDETSYNYSDMVDNISKFTNANVPLEVAVTSMIGIADAAGLAGAATSDASHAMEGFSKAIAQGYMSRQNWQWIRTAHMDTTKFKDVLIEAALAEGTLTKAADGTYKTFDNNIVSVEDFETALKDAWMTTDVMNKALAQFGGTTEEIYKEYQRTGDLTSDIIARMGTDMDDLGLKSFRAAQEAKTFSDAINSVKDAVSTGWMVSFEKVFGNYEEARHFWTDVANDMWDIFASGGESRNDLLTQVFGDMHGQMLVHQMVFNLLEGVMDVQTAFRDASESIFGTTEDRARVLYSLLEKLHGLTERFRLSETSAENLRKTFEGLLSIVRFFSITIERIIFILSPLRELFNLSSGSILEFTGNIGESITKYVDWYEKSEKVVETTNRLRSYVERATKVIKGIITYIKRLSDKYLPSISSKISEIVTRIKNSKLSGYLDKAREYLKGIWDYIEKIDFGSLDVDLSKVTGRFSGFTTAITKAYTSIKNFLLPYINKLRTAFSDPSEWISKLVTKFNELKLKVDESGGVFGFIFDKLSRLKDLVSEFLKNGGLSKIFEDLGTALDPIEQKFNDFMKNVKDQLEGVNWSNVLAFSLGFSLVPTVLSISAAFAEAAKLFKAGSGILGQVSGILKKFMDGFKTKAMEIAEAAVVFSVAIAILAGSLWVISKIPAEQLSTVVWTLVGLMAAFSGLAIAMGIIGTKFGAMSKVLVSLIAFAGGIAILAGALKLLENTTISIGNIAILMTMMAVLGAIAVGLSKFKVSLEGAGIYFLTFAGAIFLLSEAMIKIADIPTKKLDAAFEAITVLMVGLASVTALSKLVKGSSIGVLATIGAMFLIVQLLKKLSDGEISNIIKMAKDHLLEIGILLRSMIGIATILSLVSKVAGSGNPAKLGAGVLMIAGALLLVVEAIKKFSDLDKDTLRQGLASISIILVIFGLVSALSSIGKGNGAKAGAGIAIMSASLLLIYFAVKQFATLNPGELQKGLGAVLTIFALYAAILGLSALSGLAKTGPILAMAATLIVITASIAALTLFKWEDIKHSLIALSICLTLLTGAIIAIGAFKFNWQQILAFGTGVVSFIAIAKAISMLAEYNWSNVLASATALSGCLLAVSGAIFVIANSKFGSWKNVGMSLLGFAVGVGALFAIGFLISKLGEFSWSGHVATATAISECLLAIAAALRITSGIPFAAAFEATKGIFVALIALGAIVIGFGYISDLVGEDKIQKGVKMAASIGEAIGGFAAGIISGGIKALSGILPQIGEDLASFGTNASPFFEAMGKVPSNLGANMAAIGEGFLNLAKANFRDNILKIFGGTGTFDGLSAKMASLGQAVTSLGENAPDEETINSANRAISAVSKIAEAAQKLPSDGGLWQKIAGSKGIGQFGIQLKTFGTAIKNYGTSVANLNIEGIEASITAVQYVTNIADMIPSSGGVIGLFMGKTDWEGINNNLNTFGQALVDYATTVAPLVDTTGNIETSMAAVDLVNQIANSIQRSGGVVGFVAGNKDLEKFGKSLVKYGESIVAFSTTVSGINYDAIAAFTNLESLGVKIGQTLADGINSRGVDVSNATTKLVTAAKTAAQDKVTEFMAVGASIAIQTSNGIDNNASLIDTSIKEAIDLAKSSASRSMDSLMLTIQNGISIHARDISSAMDRVVSEIPKSISNGKSSLSNAFMTIMNDCIIKITSYKSEFYSAGSGLVDRLGDGIARADISYSFRSMMSNATSVIRSYYYNFYNAGRYIVTGVSDGIDDYSYLATSAVRRMAINMNNTFRYYNDINSPSGLYEKWSSYIPEGVAKGIDENSGVASDSVEHMGDMMIAAMTPAMALLAQIASGELEVNPVIHPVLDLSEVYSGSNRISEMFSAVNSLSVRPRAEDVAARMNGLDDSRLNTSGASNSGTNNYDIDINITTQPGQNANEIADAVERRLVRTLSQRKVANVK